MKWRRRDLRTETFRRIFENNEWKGEESISGPGSSMAETAQIRAELPRLVGEYGVRSILDVPCGDFHWMSTLDAPLERYIGADIVPELVARNRRDHAAPNRTFETLDLLRSPLPAVDLVLCRDLLPHFSTADVDVALRRIQRSGARLLLTTTFVGPHHENVEIQTGEWRPLNLQLQPFLLPDPLELINEDCKYENGRWSDKSLALWEVRDLIAAHGDG